MIRQCGTTGDNAVFGLFERNLQPTPLVFQPKPISSQFGYDPRLAEMFAARYEGGCSRESVQRELPTMRCLALAAARFG